MQLGEGGGSLAPQHGTVAERGAGFGFKALTVEAARFTLLRPRSTLSRAIAFLAQQAGFRGFRVEAVRSGFRVGFFGFRVCGCWVNDLPCSKALGFPLL